MRPLLGSTKFDIRHGATELTGLEIAQSWALLGGYGHLFGTFATERGLLFALTPQLERELVSQLATEVRGPAEELIRRRDMYRFFYVLAAWRVSRWGPSPARSTCLQLLRPLLGPPEGGGWAGLLWAFRRARQFAYTRLHAMLGVDIASSPIPIPTAVGNLRPLSQIGFLDEQSEPPGAVLGLIDAMDRFYGDVFFTSPAASERVLCHLRDFKRWWGAANGTLEERISALVSEPVDWPKSPPAERVHFVRLQLPDGGIGWTAEVRAWLSSRADVWGRGNFLLTPSRRAGDCSVVDVFVDGTPDPVLVSHVAAMLAARNEATWTAPHPTDTSRSLWRSIAAFGLRMFQAVLAGGRLGHLQPVAAQEGIGLAIAATSVDAGCGRLADFVRRALDESRRIELDALREISEQFRARPGVWIAFLGRLYILDETTGRQLQEIDGVFAFVEDHGIEWHFIEHKDGAAAGMRGQLNDLGRHLRVPMPTCDFVTVARGRAAHTKVTWDGTVGV